MSRALAVVFILGSFVCCAGAAATSSAPPPSPPRASTPPPAVDASAGKGGADAEVALLAAIDAAGAPDATVPFDDPMALHLDSPDELRALMGEAASVPFPVGGGPWRFSQGNRAIARHSIGAKACQEGLKGVVLQTPEQRSRCGADGMVPVWEHGGNIETARYCIDVFEFPNKPCELPFVFITAAQAVQVCHARGQAPLHAGRVEPLLPRRPGGRPGPRLRLRRRAGPRGVQHEQVPRHGADVRHLELREALVDVRRRTPSRRARSRGAARGSASSTSTATWPRS